MVTPNDEGYEPATQPPVPDPAKEIADLQQQLATALGQLNDAKGQLGEAHRMLGEQQQVNMMQQAQIVDLNGHILTLCRVMKKLS